MDPGDSTGRFPAARRAGPRKPPPPSADRSSRAVEARAGQICSGPLAAGPCRPRAASVRARARPSRGGFAGTDGRPSIGLPRESNPFWSFRGRFASGKRRVLDGLSSPRASRYCSRLMPGRISSHTASIVRDFITTACSANVRRRPAGGYYYSTRDRGRFLACIATPNPSNQFQTLLEKSTGVNNSHYYVQYAIRNVSGLSICK